MAEGTKDSLSQACFTRALISFLSTDLIPPRDSASYEVRVSTYEFFRDINIQILETTYPVVSLDP
jgi:hypothetical protein